MAVIEKAWDRFPGYVIELHPLDATARARKGDLVLAESDRCLVMKESDHLDQLYFPEADVNWNHFVESDHHTVCPFKGEADYWSLASGGSAEENVLWTYRTPFEEVGGIQGYVAFYHERVEVSVTEHWGLDENDDVTKRFPYWGTGAELTTLMDVAPAGEGRFVAPTFPDPPLGTFFEWARNRPRRNVIEAGQLLGDGIVAASKAVPGQRVTSAYMIFAKAASFDEPLEVNIDVLRRGRTISTIEVRIDQDQRLRAAGMVMMDAGADDLIRSVVDMPDVPGPYESPSLDMSVLGRDLRVVDGAYTHDPEAVGPPEILVWARFKDAPAHQYLHQALLTQSTGHWTIAAAMRPHPGISEAEAHRSISTGIMSTSIAFHDEVDVSEWLLYANPAVYAGRGSAQGQGLVFTRDGRLVASYSVQAIVRGFASDPAAMGKDYSDAM